ncbi:MAG: glycosyltransferase family 4 protein [Verrucomicrobiae bacterium]|nr:glycosyltransferase family 4 protein [Verrucomicrobiae bacterium]
MGKIIELTRVWARLLRLRRGGPIDVILYPVGGPHLAPLLRDLCLLPLARLCARRVVLHFRAAGLAEALPRLPAPARFLVGKTYRACGEAIALTNFGRRDPEAAGIPADRIAVVPNGCEDRHRSDFVSIAQIRASGAPLTLLNAGLLCSDKGSPALIEAFAGLTRRFPERSLRLRLAGSPMGDCTTASLRDLAEKHGVGDRVELCGVLEGEALDRAYASGDLFVFSTVAPFESFGMVLIEAMMWGLPIVATDWRANTEVFGEDPGGLLADTTPTLAAGLESALATALERESEWPGWSEKNRRRFVENFGIDRSRERLARLMTGAR